MVSRDGCAIGELKDRGTEQINPADVIQPRLLSAYSLLPYNLYFPYYTLITMFAGVLRYPLRPVRCHPTLHSRLKAFGSNSPESFHFRLNSFQNLLAFRLAVIKNDKKLVIIAATQAQKAANYILGI